MNSAYLESNIRVSERTEGNQTINLDNENILKS